MRTSMYKYSSYQEQTTKNPHCKGSGSRSKRKKEGEIKGREEVGGSNRERKQETGAGLSCGDVGGGGTSGQGGKRLDGRRVTG